MELFQLETFLAVAEEKSFSRAAARMHRTQSAVSQTISKLEDELGERLFDRSSRDGSLTDAGQVLQTYAKELLNVREEARESLKELRMLHQGKLVIAANEFTSRYLLPVLHQFHRTHPMIRIQVMRTLAREVPGQVISHQVEFGVVSFRPEDGELTSHVLYRDELALIVYPRHPLAHAKHVGIKDLGAESFIAHSVLSPYREKVIQAFKKHHTPLHMNVELPNIAEGLLKLGFSAEDVAKILGGNFMRVFEAVWKPNSLRCRARVASQHTRRQIPSRGSGDKAVLRLLEEFDDLLSTNGGKTGPKIVDRLSGFQVIKERLNRHPSAGKNCCAPHHFGAARDNWLSHTVRLLPTPRLVQLWGFIRDREKPHGSPSHTTVRTGHEPRLTTTPFVLLLASA